MSEGRTLPTVSIGHLESHDGGTGVSIRVGETPRRRRSTVPSTAGEPPFTGRAEQLEALERAVADGNVAIVHGPPGLGKSRLAKEYASLHATEYEGGTFFVYFGDGTPPLDLARLLRELDEPAYPGEPVADQCRRGLGQLGQHGRALIIFDAVPDEDTLRSWLPRTGLDWSLVVTSTFMDWSTTWTTLELTALSEQESHVLVARILKNDSAASQLASTLIDRAGGVTIELCASTLAVAARVRKGRKAEVAAALMASTTSSFEASWSLLSSSSQLLMRVACAFATRRVPVDLVRSALVSSGWTGGAVDDEIDAVRARGLASGIGDELEIHQLVARFVRENGAPWSHSIRLAMFDSLRKVASEFSACPGDIELRARLLSHDVELAAWADVANEWHSIGEALLEAGAFAQARVWFEQAVTEAQGDARARFDHAHIARILHQIGRCVSNLGNFDEARSCFERAASEARRGDPNGRVDHAGVGASLHEVGACLFNLGQYSAAQEQFQQAVTEGQKGDAEGRIDHEKLGRALHLVGYCLRGHHGEARVWFERAALEAELGDLHGRVNHESLGTSLHQVGGCLWALGQFAEARTWYERAVSEGLRGDEYGRVDHASVGASLHQVGICLSSLGLHAEAFERFEQAARYARKGDVYGRIDHEHLSRSLYQAGYCQFMLEQFAAALPLLEMAATEAQMGDVHGRTNHTTNWGRGLVGTTLRLIGYCLTRLDREEEARAWFERSDLFQNQGVTRVTAPASALNRSPIGEGVEGLAGSWRHVDGTGLYCARAVGSELRLAYCFNGTDKLDAHFYDVRVVHRILVARFRWFVEPFYMGYVMLHVQSSGRLSGSWWFEKDFRPHNAYARGAELGLDWANEALLVLADKNVLNKIILVRDEPPSTFPEWAEEYFERSSVALIQ